MGGFFGVAAKEDCVFDLFFGTDYHSHLGTRRAGMAVYSKEEGYNRAIHNIENAPFRTKFDKDVNEMRGNLGIGCISDFEPQPLMVRSHHGTYAITTVGKINNTDAIIKDLFAKGHSHFLEMSGGDINATELVAAIVNQKDNLVEGIQYAQEIIEGSMTLLIMTPKGIYAARDKMGRTPVAVGKKEGAYCVSFESFAYLNLGYQPVRELGPGEIAVVTPEGVRTLVQPGKDMKICTFLWVYYGYPSSSYEGISVEKMRYQCGAKLAERDHVKPDIVAGVPDSGTAHAVGYANRSGIPFSRPFIKYTPTWPRSFMPTIQTQRNLIAKMKLIPVHDLIQDQSLLLICLAPLILFSLILFSLCFYFLLVEVPADIFRRRFHRVFAGKAALTDTELTAHQFFQSLDLQIVQTVCTDEVTDLLHRTVICDQLVSRRNIRTEIAGPQKRR
jgi:amidophosphoribosyltransferase